MKTLKSVFVLLAFVAVTFLGCSDKSQSPIAPSANDDAVTSLMKASGSGAWIFRYEDVFATWWIDEESGLVIALGVNDISLLCSGGGGRDTANIKDILLPNTDPDLRRWIQQVKGQDLTAMVWRPDPWPSEFTDFCSFYDLVGEPMAIGTAKVSSKDNDVLAWMQDNKNSNAFGYKANGTLKDLNGKVYKLNFVYRSRWDGVDFTSANVVFKIQLTPTGK